MNHLELIFLFFWMQWVGTMSTTDWEEVTALGEPSRNGCDGRVRCHPLIMHSDA
jgi:hypothetical protein